MFLKQFSLGPEALRTVLTTGGVGRFMSDPKRNLLDGIVDDLSGRVGRGLARPEFTLNARHPGTLIVAKDRQSMLNGLLTLREPLTATGLGAVVALSGSYAGPFSRNGLKRRIADPFRQVVGGVFDIMKHDLPQRASGTMIHRSRLRDRGFFVLFTGRILVRQLPGDTRMTVCNGYSVMVNVFAPQAVPPE